MALVQPKIRQGSDSSGLHTPTATRITPPLPPFPSFASHLSTPPSASHARHPPLGFSPSSFLWGVSPKGIRERDEERGGRVRKAASFRPIPFGHIPTFPPGMAKGQRCCCRAGYRGQEEAQTGAGSRGDPWHADPLLTGGGHRAGGCQRGTLLAVRLCPSGSFLTNPSRGGFVGTGFV